MNQTGQSSMDNRLQQRSFRSSLIWQYYWKIAVLLRAARLLLEMMSSWYSMGNNTNKRDGYEGVVIVIW